MNIHFKCILKYVEGIEGKEWKGSWIVWATEKLGKIKHALVCVCACKCDEWKEER